MTEERQEREAPAPEPQTEGEPLTVEDPDTTNPHAEVVTREEVILAPHARRVEEAAP